MKTISIIFSTAFITCSLISCQTKSNVALSGFTKELILLYMNDYNRFFEANKKEEIIVYTLTDTLNYYLRIHSHSGKLYKYCEDNLVGKTSYLGYSVKVYGDIESVFYSVEEKISRQKPCKMPNWEYDPPTWVIALNKDLSFCKDRTYKVRDDADISSIQNLAAKYFKIPDDLQITP